ncbi:MAG: OmpA family protein [Cyclobacteriaceae bacterium]
MKTSTISLLSPWWFLLILGCPAFAQDAAKALFAPLDQKIAEAKTQHADLYAPRHFSDGMLAYQAAVKAYRAQEDADDVQKAIQQATSDLDQALAHTKVAQATFPDVWNARLDAMEAQAMKYQPEGWQEAEKQFDKATRQLERGRLDNAREDGEEAEQYYRKAELDAIKNNYLVSARQLIEQADELKADREAPQTFKRAQDLLAQAEKDLNENRYDFDAARLMAQQAEYEARHAMYLADKIKQLEKSDVTIEGLLLAGEASVSTVASAADMVAKFDQGMEMPVNALVEHITTYQDSASYLANALASAENQITDLEALNEEQKKMAELLMKEKSAELEQQIAEAAQKQDELARKLAWQERIAQKFDQAYEIFNEDQAQVFRQADDIIIRLYGLTFPVGKADIDPEYFPLLTSVQTAINLFDNAEVIIEGHTDAQGGDKINQELSEKRASAVRDYMLANMELSEEQVMATGFGESRPIANNETTEGRQKNRRIDVVIQPQFIMEAQARN